MDELYGVSRGMYDSSNKEIIFSRGEGCYIFDTEGRKYIDLILGYGPSIMEHGHTYFVELIRNALMEGDNVSFLWEETASFGRANQTLL